MRLTRRRRLGRRLHDLLDLLRRDRSLASPAGLDLPQRLRTIHTETLAPHDHRRATRPRAPWRSHCSNRPRCPSARSMPSPPRSAACHAHSPTAPAAPAAPRNLPSDSTQRHPRDATAPQPPCQANSRHYTRGGGGALFGLDMRFCSASASRPSRCRAFLGRRLNRVFFADCGKRVVEPLHRCSRLPILLLDAEPSRKERGRRGVRPRHPSRRAFGSVGSGFLKRRGTASFLFVCKPEGTSRAPALKTRSDITANSSWLARMNVQEPHRTVGSAVSSIMGQDRDSE